MINKCFHQGQLTVLFGTQGKWTKLSKAVLEEVSAQASGASQGVLN